MKPHSAKGLTRLGRAFQWSWAGLRHAAVNETAFRQELLLGSFLIPLGLWLGKSPVERILLVSSVLLVFLVELLNSSIEAAVDRVGLEMDPLAGHAKDMGSAAVFISLLNAACVWLIILIW